jgi:hypothetical protein
MDARKLAAEAKAKALADLKAAEEMERAANQIAELAAQQGWDIDIIAKVVDKNVVHVEAKKTPPAQEIPASGHSVYRIPIVKKRGGKAPDPNSTTSRSKAEGVKIVRELMRPVPLGEMAKRLEARGIKLGGKDPNQALSANLGKCPELKPTPRGWWLKGEPMPRNTGKVIGGNEELPGLN